jgi:hypothetical protein
VNTVPNGKYTARAVKAEFRASQNTGTEWVSVTFRVDDGEWQGAEVEWWGFLTEKAMARTMEALLVLGFQGDDVLAFIDECPASAPNAVRITTKEETYKGTTKARVEYVDALGGSVGAPAGERDQIRARTRAAMQEARTRLGIPTPPARPLGAGAGARAAAPAARRVAPPPPAPTADGMLDEDVPF